MKEEEVFTFYQKLTKLLKHLNNGRYPYIVFTCKDLSIQNFAKMFSDFCIRVNPETQNFYLQNYLDKQQPQILETDQIIYTIFSQIYFALKSNIPVQLQPNSNQDNVPVQGQANSKQANPKQADPKQADPAIFTQTLTEFLQSLGLEKLIDKFILHEISTVKELVNLTVSDYKDMDIKLGSRNKILEKLGML